ncbi:MAG TPA: rhomboid family intramembrane serine protease [Acidobacteriota bacterium]|jgi:membrane associated rhomboid family serine protease
MIPLRDENPTRTVPFVNHALVAVNIAVFAYQVLLAVDGGPQATMAFIERLAVTPAVLLSPASWSQAPVPPPATLMTSMFVHGSFLHLAGNMLYLWVFGDNIEDSMGHLKYLVFYIACGLGAAVAQVAVAPSSALPMVGASGAIAGVLGAYLVLHPTNQVLTLVFLVIFIRVMYLPAVVLLGLWFIIQIFSALNDGGGGVAWYAHIGGFLVGVLLIGIFAASHRRPPRKRRNLHVVH